MNKNLLLDNSFASTLVNSLPCGLVVVDRNGCVRAVNNISERVLMISEQTVIGKGTGDVLGCLHVSDHPKGCGFAECCHYCEVQKLAVKALDTNKNQKVSTHFELVIDGQVRDLTLFLSAFPFTFDDESFSILMIENLSTISAFAPKEVQEGFWGLVGSSPKMLELFDTIRGEQDQARTPSADPPALYGKSKHHSAARIKTQNR